MLALNRNRKFRISNRMAAFAAILLVVTSLAGVGGSATLSTDNSAMRMAMAEAEEDTATMMRAAGASKANGNKGFKMSLFLFRNH